MRLFEQRQTVSYFYQSLTTWVLLGSPISSCRFQHFTNHYSDSTYFFLTVGSVPGKRITDQQSPVTFTDSTTTYTGHAVHESEQINFLHSGQEWYGEHFNVISGQTIFFPVMLKNISPIDSTTFNISFAGKDTSGQGSLIFSFNGSSSLQPIPAVGTTAQDNYASLVNFSRYSYVPSSVDSLGLLLQS